MSDIKKIIKQELKFYKKIKEDENSRYRSWEYCYKNFYDAHKSEIIDEEKVDYLSLQLAFYLASWGMYRGSSFLLQKDYKIHKPIIKLLFNKEYDSLWGIKINEYKKIENQEKLINLVNSIRDVYNNVRGAKNKNEVSDTLVTKILLGTMGCVPAYDRYFVSGVRNEKVTSGCFNIQSILGLVDFYNKYYNEFEEVRKQIKVSGIKYPQMKMIDSCFWQIGYDLDENNIRKQLY